VTTRALTPRIAVVLAAVGNLVGGVIGLAVVTELASDLVVVSAGQATPAVLSAFVVAVAWNLLTWARGMPSSSTHALLAALVGGALALGAVVHWSIVGERVLVPMLLSPVLGLLVALGGTVALGRSLDRRPVDPHGPTSVGALRQAQTVSAAMVAVAHGIQDAAKPVAVVALPFAAAAGGGGIDEVVPLWVFAGISVALALGSLAGGWRVVHTLGRGIVELDSPSGFAAETATAVVLAGATALGLPVSSTQTVTAAIVGTGLARGRRAVRWHTVRRVLLTWVATPLACGLAGAALAAVLSAF
jgi:PiT family inorganic phosphate transporter